MQHTPHHLSADSLALLKKLIIENTKHSKLDFNHKHDLDKFDKLFTPDMSKQQLFAQVEEFLGPTPEESSPILNLIYDLLS